MKRRLVLALALVITACGGDATPDTSSTTGPTSTTTVELTVPTLPPTTTTTVAPTTLATAPSTTTTAAPIPCPTAVLGPALDTPDDLEAIAARGVVRVAVVAADNPPFFWCERTGEYTGFEAEIVRYVVEAVFGDIEIGWVPVTAGDRFTLMEEGRVDLAIRNTTVTPDRARRVDFATPYLMDGVAVMVPGESGVTLEELDGLRLAFVTGSPFETRGVDALANAGVSYEAVSTDWPPSDAVTTGAADGYVWAWTVGVMSAQTEAISVIPLEFDEQLAPFVARGQRELLDAIDDAVTELIGSGAWATLFEEAFASPPPWTIEEMTG